MSVSIISCSERPFMFDARYHDVDEVLNHPAQWSSHQLAGQDVSALNSNYFDDSLSATSLMPCQQQQQQFSSSQQQQCPPSSHTPSPVPPSPVPPHLTVNTGYTTGPHHNLQSPTPSPMSPHTYPAPASHQVQYHQYQTGQMITKSLKVLPPVSSPLQQVPSPGQTPNSLAHRKKPMGGKGDGILPKPAYSYSCLIALALKNSPNGSMSVSEIYKFMCEHFPYFKTAPNGWKNSVRHNLSLNKCFEKIEKPSANGTNQRKGCLWAMNPEKITKMDEEVKKWSRKDPQAIREAKAMVPRRATLWIWMVFNQCKIRHPCLNLTWWDSVTFFKAIVGAEDLFDQLADDGLEDISMEPLNTSDLINIKAMTTLTGRPTVTLSNVANIKSPVILSNMGSPINIKPRVTGNITNLKTQEKLNFITVKNPLEKSKLFIS